MNSNPPIRYLVASDFDQTLSQNDSGEVLGEILGIPDFLEKVQTLSDSHLVHQGAELAWLLRHDPDFAGVRREHLIEAGRKVRLKGDVALLTRILRQELDHAQFEFVVISAGPRDVVQAALQGIVPPENVYGSEFDYDPATGAICRIRRVSADYGKVAVLQEVEARYGTSPAHTIYIGDGSSDLYVMHHVNSRDGLTIAVSETKAIGRIARRTVMSENAMSVLAPMLEDVLAWDAARIRRFYEGYGLSLQGWDKIRTDWLTFHKSPPLVALAG